ncbi:MAG: hypothetical protein OXH78_09875 [Acidimicrobiaceae bacterium]|nr:hypothetical protein [Acidimicrobiaceae bacterium]
MTAPLLIVGGDSEIASDVALLERRGDRLHACPAPAENGTNECIDEWLSSTSSPRHAAVFRLGEGSDRAAAHLRDHDVTVERFSDRQSLMAALERFGR